jgi:hypothetical protein
MAAFDGLNRRSDAITEDRWRSDSAGLGMAARGKLRTFLGAELVQRLELK